MRITVNKSEAQVPDGVTVTGLLRLRGHDPSRAAVWINGVQVWRRDYDSCSLNAGDNVTIIRPIAGG